LHVRKVFGLIRSEIKAMLTEKGAAMTLTAEDLRQIKTIVTSAILDRMESRITTAIGTLQRNAMPVSMITRSDSQNLNRA